MTQHILIPSTAQHPDKNKQRKIFKGPANAGVVVQTLCQQNFDPVIFNRRCPYLWKIIPYFKFKNLAYLLVYYPIHGIMQMGWFIKRRVLVNKIQLSIGVFCKG